MEMIIAMMIAILAVCWIQVGFLKRHAETSIKKDSRSSRCSLWLFFLSILFILSRTLQFLAALLFCEAVTIKSNENRNSCSVAPIPVAIMVALLIVLCLT